MNRYEVMFGELGAQGEGALVPFVMLGDPDPATSLAIIATLVEHGADALELGIPFSDPIADGPVIQRAALRALAAGATPAQCLDLVGQVRAEHPKVPIGLLVYANLVTNHGLLDFYQAARSSGVDSVLVADVPSVEMAPFHQAARQAGVAPVLLLPHDADLETVSRVAQMTEGYTYLLGRAGVTGHESQSRRPNPDLLAALEAAGGAPALVGFGIAGPDQVREVMSSGAAGVIVGSAIVALIEQYHEDAAKMHCRLGGLVRELKEATTRPRIHADLRGSILNRTEQI
ncbi:MAG TPA: tryptophan synthase subunit alpha [Gemmatimonadales bacterium]|jgi:tryptophan synthase alpha chain|nr:tryptophan synthase subunit alpha [Gemmatimonadales bacterium]